jgi:hypothetical protein
VAVLAAREDFAKLANHKKSRDLQILPSLIPWDFDCGKGLATLSVYQLELSN